MSRLFRLGPALAAFVLGLACAAPQGARADSRGGDGVSSSRRTAIVVAAERAP